MGALILPKKDLHILHVRNALGYPSTDLGTLCGGVAACAAKINKWAKYKPVRYNFSDNRPANWWKANDGFCGLSIPTYPSSNIANILSAMDSGIQWTYLPPRGNSTEPFRLGDYAGYNHDAYFPLSEPIIPDVFYQTAGYLQVNVDWDAEIDDTILNITDISNLSSYYFAALMKYPTGGYIWKTYEDTIGVGKSIQVDLPLQGTQSGYTYKVYSFLSSAKKTSTEGGDPSGTIVPLPFAPKSFKVLTSAYRTDVYAEQRTYGSAIVDYTASVKNIGSSSGTFTNVSVSVIFMLRSNDTVVFQDKQILTFTLNAESTKTLITGSVDLSSKPGYISGYDLNNLYRVKFVSDNDYLNYGDFEIDTKAP